MAKLRFGRQPTRDRHLPAAAAGLAVAALLTLVWYSSVPQQGAATATAITGGHSILLMPPHARPALTLEHTPTTSTQELPSPALS